MFTGDFFLSTHPGRVAHGHEMSGHAVDVHRACWQGKAWYQVIYHHTVI